MADGASSHREFDWHDCWLRPVQLTLQVEETGSHMQFCDVAALHAAGLLYAMLHRVEQLLLDHMQSG